MGMWSDAVRRLNDDIDLAPDPQREDERIREERWTAFVRRIRDYHSDGWQWQSIVGSAEGAMCDDRSWSPEIEREIGAFADEFGWPDTLRALARAMDEQQAEMAEVERRR